MNTSEMGRAEDDVPTDYILDAFVEDGIDEYEEASDYLDDCTDEELIEIVYELHDDLLELDFEGFALYGTARDLLFQRGYGFGGGVGMTIVDEDGTPLDRHGNPVAR